MKKKTLIIIGIIVLAIALCLGGLYYYISGTPQYSLYQLAQAVKNHDSETVMQYFDIDRVVSQTMDVVSQQIQSDTSSEDDFTKSLADAILPGMIDQEKQTIKNDLVNKIEDISKNGSDNQMVKSKIQKVVREGKSAEVTINYGNNDTMTFKMIQEQNRRWKIVGFGADDLKKLMQ